MGAVLTIITISIIVAGFAFWMYGRSKPKRVGYVAKVHKQVGTGKNAETKLFVKDFLFRENPAANIVHWRLEKLRLLLPFEPSPEMIEEEGKERVLNLLLKRGQLTILKKRYDDTNDSQIFEAFDYDKYSFCETKRTHELKRLETQKNPLELITKWIVVALTMFGLIGVSYVQAEGWVNSSENLLAASENNLMAANIQANATRDLQKVLYGVNNPNELQNNQVVNNQDANQVKSMG